MNGRERDEGCSEAWYMEGLGGPKGVLGGRAPWLSRVELNECRRVPRGDGPDASCLRFGVSRRARPNTVLIKSGPRHLIRQAAAATATAFALLIVVLIACPLGGRERDVRDVRERRVVLISLQKKTELLVVQPQLEARRVFVGIHVENGGHAV